MSSLCDGELHLDQRLWRLWVGIEDKAISKCDSCWFNASCQSRACPLAALDDPNLVPPCPSNPRELANLVQLSAYGRAPVSGLAR